MIVLPVPRKKIPATVQQAIALHQQGKLDEAEPLYKSVLATDPKEIDSLLNLSTLKVQRGQLAEAETLLKTLATTYPKYAYGLYAYGNTLQALGKSTEALAYYKRALALSPNDAEMHHNYAVALESTHDHDAALSAYARAIAIKGSLPISSFNRGLIYQSRGDNAAALANYNDALAAHPNYVDALINRAIVFNRLHRFTEALADSERALALDPRAHLAHNNRGNALTALGQPQQALADYERARALQPDYVDPYWNTAVNLLALGNYPEGGKFYEWRWKTNAQKHLKQEFSVPLWLGDAPIEGKTIYVYYEQGYGDFIQCVRYVPLLLARGAQVILETFPALGTLFQESFAHPNLRIFTGQRPLPAFDYHCPIMSLPLAMGTTLDTIPASIPYLTVPAANQARWQQRLGPKTRTRVGLVWSGAAHHVNDQHRSIPLETFAPLLALPFEFHCLQKDIREGDLAHFGPMHRHDAELQDFADTAALVQQMDLVISVDTSVAHLAGALGRPLWVLLPRYSTDYRWLLARSDSPWYPTARLFRQAMADDWPNAIKPVIEALTTYS